MDRTPPSGEQTGHPPEQDAPVVEELLPGHGVLSSGPLEWAVERATGTAQQLHDAPIDLTRRRVRVHQLRDRAVVLGSTQPDSLVDHVAAARSGVTVARRRSGGGAVYLAPAGQVWVDVVVPAGDPLWDADIGRASWWLGECWAEALAGRSSAAPTVHRSGVSDRVLARIACFAALGPGEIGIDDRKVVGISQRRTRDGARFQCVAYTRWDPEPMLSVLDMGDEAAAVTQALRSAAGAVPSPPAEPAPAAPADPAGVSGDEWSVVEDFLRSLP